MRKPNSNLNNSHQFPFNLSSSDNANKNRDVTKKSLRVIISAIILPEYKLRFNKHHNITY